jgi:hypothetical protein
MKRKPAPAASKLDAAWGAFFDSQKLDDPKKLRAEGWRTPQEIAETLGTTINAARTLCSRNAESGKFEQKKTRLPTNHGARAAWVYRPKL